MTTPSVWARSVPLIQDGQAVRASVTNPPLQVLSDRTAALKAILDSLAAGQQLVWRDAPLDASVSAGMVVSLDAASLTQKPATAIWRTTLTADGRLLPALSAVYTGVVLTKSTAASGDVLMYGIGQLAAAAQTVLFNGVAPVLDVYFLSSLNAGTVELAPPAMMARTLQYLGDNLIRVFPPQDFPVTHTHKAYDLLAANWRAASLFPTPAAGASFGYDLTTDPVLAELLLPSVGEPSFFYSNDSATPGIHLDDAIVILNSDGIWWYPLTAPDDTVHLVVTSADVRDMALLNTIESLTPLAIEILNRNGRVTVEELAFALDAAATSGAASWTAVKSIVNHKQLAGYVVSKVKAGVGLTAIATQGDDQGEVTLALAEFHDQNIDAQVMNLDNAVTDVDGAHVFVNFPATRTSRVQARLTLPNFGTAHYQAYLHGNFLSPAPGQAAPTVSYILIPTPAAAGVTPTAPAVATLPAFPGAIVAGNVYLTESAAIDLAGYSQGMIEFSLEAVSPSADLKMLDCGIRLELVP